MGDSLVGMTVISLYVGAFAIWCYGVAVCLRTAEYFWAVFSFAMPPVGFIIGIYNMIF